MRLGQGVVKPALFQVKQKYKGFFDEIDKCIGNDRKLKELFEHIIIYLEWHCLFLERINKDAQGKLNKSEQEREYRRFKKEVSDMALKMQKYFANKMVMDLPEDKGTIIKELQDELIRCNKDTEQTNMLIEQLKDWFEIKRVKANERYKIYKTNQEMVKTIKELLLKSKNLPL